MRHGISAFLVLGVLVVSSFTDSLAIVTRHDRDDVKYRELGDRYPQAVSVLPDGTGVLVAPRWVLTAAHVARGVSRRNPRVEAGGREYDVARIFIHRDWKEMPHDIALLELGEPIEGITPVKLYRGDDEVGQTIVFAGRGDTGTGLTGPQAADRIKRGATNVVDRADDDWLYFSFDEGDSGTDLEGVSGPGDSGGPALITRDGEVYTLGVSVFADGKGKGPGRYGVTEGYTRVSTHAEWIDAVLAGKHRDAAIVPGAAPPSGGKRVVRRGPGGKGMTRAMPMGAGPSELPDTPAARVVGEYLRVYNTDDAGAMAAFIAASFDPEFRDSKTEEEHLDLYRRLQKEHFGQITLQSVIEASTEAITVLCSSALGPHAELRFDVSGGDEPRIAGLRIGVVAFD